MKSYQITGKSISEVNIPQVLDDIYSDSIETPKEENNCEINISKLTLKKSLSKSNTFENYINDNIMYNNNIYIKNENSNSPNKEEMKKSRTFNDIDAFQNVKYNFHFNNGQNYLETVLETLNEVSNSKIDLSTFIKPLPKKLLGINPFGASIASMYFVSSESFKVIKFNPQFYPIMF